MPAKLKALLATARIANVPSVVSNVLTGWIIGQILYSLQQDAIEFKTHIWLPVLAGCCLYIAGNFLNDWKDATWDRDHRPDRAIPSGVFPRVFYLVMAVTLTLGGWLCLLRFHTIMTIVYAFIIVLVISYTWLHKKYTSSIWLMGACRASLYVLGISAWFKVFDKRLYPNDPEILLYILLLCFPIIGMLCYIAGISLLARHESKNFVQGGTKLIASILLLSPCLTHSCIWITASLHPPVHFSYITLLVIAPFACWTWFAIVRRCSVAQKVSCLLAGIALLDSVFIWCAYVSSGIISLTNVSQVLTLLFPLLAFFAALLLQKLAPAT